MLKKTAARIIYIVLISMMLISCQGVGEEPFYDINEQASGGVIAPEQGMNIKDIDISYFQNQTEIALHIIYGSREETQSEAIVTDLPKYEVKLLDEPYRLAVRLYGIDYIDYIEKSSWALDEHVAGVFRERIANKDYITVYFQLNTRVKFRVDEGDGKIRIMLETDKTEKENSHFVMLNAFDEYLEGAFSDEFGLTPVLCADRQNIAMISEPFKTSEEAEKRLNALNALIKTSPISKTPYTMTLAGEALPIINLDIDQFVPGDKKMVMKDGTASVLPVLFENGRIAAQYDQTLLFIKPYTPEQNRAVTDGEALWLLTNGDKKTQLDLPPFTSIQGAEFSSDGRYIAFIDITVGSRVLYVYDREMDVLYNLGEEGFGVTTSSLTWAKDGYVLYAMTGDETLRLSRCAFIDGGLDVHVISEETGGEGKIADFNNTIIFADNSAGEHGIIYSINKTTGEKTFLTEGVDFEIAPDGSGMAGDGISGLR